jgi:outer membrane beta-barrel protein
MVRVTGRDVRRLVPAAFGAVALLLAAPSWADAPAPAVAPAPAQPPAPAGSCVDEDLKHDLVGGRHYRGVQPRLFTKSFRHELSALGGWLAGDANDGAPWWGGSYTFHFSEDLGLEASVGFSRARAKLADTIERRFPQPIEVYRNDRRVQQYLGHLVWSLAYGKMRWMGGAISRFDFHFAFGGGVADDEVSRGLLGSFGIGSKIYFTSWLALRLELRDQISSQKILDDRRIVNDLLFFGGLSVFLPFKG